MKKQLSTLAGLAAVLVLFCLQGCLKDSYTKSYRYTYYVPVYQTTAEVRAGIQSNPAQPVESPGKLYIKGNYIFLNEVDRGVHVIDNSDPSHPRSVAFINIPGNMDLAVKGNTLYADLYTDLVAIDITDPLHVTLKKVVEDVFPHRYYNNFFVPDSTKVIARWEKRDTVITERGSIGGWLKSANVYMNYAMPGSGQALATAGKAASPYGVGGSMARFTIVNQRLYTVGSSDLRVFNIANETDPNYVTKRDLGWNIETIYPFLNRLFIGSQTGMFIYDISSADNPVLMGQFAHVFSCDPVISDGSYAYVTLRSGTTCAHAVNELDVLALNNILAPSLIRSYPMTNPHGLAKDGSLLFLCDGNDGLKLFDASDLSQFRLISKVAVPEANDVIAFGGLALLVAKDGLYQYRYSPSGNLQFLSKITLQN